MLEDSVISRNVYGNLLKVSVRVMLRAVVDKVVVDLAEEVLRSRPLHNEGIITFAGEIDNVRGTRATDVGEKLERSTGLAFSAGSVRLDPHLVLRVRSCR